LRSPIARLHVEQHIDRRLDHVLILSPVRVVILAIVVVAMLYKMNHVLLLHLVKVRNVIHLNKSITAFISS
jgi:hypothetical protein